MKTIILSNLDSTSALIRAGLRRHGVECSASQVFPFDHGWDGLDDVSSKTDLTFFAAKALDAPSIDLLRRFRNHAGRESTIVVVTESVGNGDVLNCLRAGANDLLMLGATFDSEMGSLLTRVRDGQLRNKDKGRVLTVLPCQSKRDADLLSINIAAVLASRLGSCGLFDLHFRGGDLALLLKCSPKHTVVDLVTRSDAIDEAMLLHAIEEHETGISLLAGPTVFADLAKMRRQACSEIVSLGTRCWPAVILNAEDAQHADQMQALAVSDDVVLTMRLDIASLHRAQQHIEFLRDQDLSPNRIHAVAFGVGHEGELPAAEVKKHLNLAELYVVPDDPVAVNRSINLGVPLVTDSPRSKSAVALSGLADSIFGCTPAKSAEVSPLTSLKAAALLATNSLLSLR